jgi:uncharacterized protein YqeY
MTLEEKINADIKAAMLAKDSKKLDAIRAIKSAIILLKTSPDGNSPDAELKTLQKMVKQRRETADIYKQQNREDLAADEIFQAEIIEKYLPAQMSEQELAAALKEIIAQVGASSAADFGKVMGVASKSLSGKADGKAISTLVKQLLG